jgi:hypothetical protein
MPIRRGCAPAGNIFQGCRRSGVRRQPRRERFPALERVGFRRVRILRVSADEEHGFVEVVLKPFRVTD